MRTVRIKFFPALALGSTLCLLMLYACNPTEIEIPGTPAFVTLSGTVTAISLSGIEPLPNATVELEDGTITTVSDADGSWTMENVPTGGDPVKIVTATGDLGDYPPAYNTFPLSSLNLLKYDLQIAALLLHLPPVQVAQVHFFEVDLPPCTVDKSQNDSTQSRLATSGLAHQSQRLALFH